ncbi:ABC transporter permease, partial [Streptomyces sp. NPDC006356]
ARRLSDDPRGAWRTVSGLVLAGLVAGFFAVSQLDSGFPSHPDQVAVIADNGTQARHKAVEARTLLDRAGVEARVTTVSDADFSNSVLLGNPGVVAQVSGGKDQIDTAITALAPLGEARLPISQDYVSAGDDTMSARIATVSTATLILSFLVATASAGLTAAANILDRRRVYGLLRLSGAPLKVLDRARVRETVLPLVALAGGTTAMGVFCGYQLNKAAGATVDTAGAVQLGVCVGIGALAIFAAIGCSKPLLRKVTANPTQTAD